MIGFPPAEEERHDLRPIDYHDYTTSEIPKKYHVIRADILPTIKWNGIYGRSGDLRALIVVLENTYYFIGFTTEHDFDNSEMLTRIEKTEKDVRKNKNN